MSPSTRELPRTLGFFGASAIMVGIVIGSGIFRTPASIADELNSPMLILGLWALGGLIALCGALTFAELATMLPASGGVYVFLREAYGRAMAFVFGWTYLLISKPAAAAGIAIIFAQHVNALFGTQWDDRVITTAILIALTIINVRGTALGGAVAMVLTSLKILALLAIVVLALVLMKGDTANFALQPAPGAEPGLTVGGSLLFALVPVMAAIMWTYDGWSDVGAVAGEVKNPQRSLPRIYLAGTAAVTGLYVAVNAVYLWVLPLEDMRATDTVAPLMMDQLVGPAGATVVTLIVLISTMGSTQGSIITGARVSYAQARDGLLFGFLGSVHPKYLTPAVSLWFQLALSITAVWVLGNFREMAETFVFTMWIFYGLAGAAVFILRYTRPDAQRPYRCWGYPVVPALFVLCSLAMTVLSLIENPVQNGIWIGVLLAGVPVYLVWSRFATPRRDEAVH